MKPMENDLGQLRRGSRVHVTLTGRDGNVRVVNRANPRAFVGCKVRRSVPYTFEVPDDGRWYLSVEMLGEPGRIKAEWYVEPPELPEDPSARSFPEDLSARPLREYLRHDRPSRGHWDVFVSYAHEDRKAVARPIVDALERRSIKVWFDQFELRMGASLTRQVNSGLAESRFGIVVLSPSYFTREWAMRELGAMFLAEIGERQGLLPIWHRISRDDVLARFPLLADKIARSTEEFTIDEIADEIAEFVHERD